MEMLPSAKQFTNYIDQALATWNLTMQGDARMPCNKDETDICDKKGSNQVFTSNKDNLELNIYMPYT